MARDIRTRVDLASHLIQETSAKGFVKSVMGDILAKVQKNHLASNLCFNRS